MRIRIFGKGLILVVGFILLFSAMTFAVEVRIQGSIDALDLKRNWMNVNESIFVWDSNTLFLNERGDPIKVEQFKKRSWVYIEGARGANIGQTTIKKIYLLPKYINQMERSQYPFMR